MTENQKLAALLGAGVLFGLAMKFVANLWFHVAWVVVMTLITIVLWKRKKSEKNDK